MDKQQSNGPSNNNTVIGTLAVDGWAVTFGTAMRGLGGLRYQLNIIQCGSIFFSFYCSVVLYVYDFIVIIIIGSAF